MAVFMGLPRGDAELQVIVEPPAWLGIGSIAAFMRGTTDDGATTRNPRESRADSRLRVRGFG